MVFVSPSGSSDRGELIVDDVFCSLHVQSVEDLGRRGSTFCDFKDSLYQALCLVASHHHTVLQLSQMVLNSVVKDFVPDFKNITPVV